MGRLRIQLSITKDEVISVLLKIMEPPPNVRMVMTLMVVCTVIYRLRTLGKHKLRFTGSTIVSTYLSMNLIKRTIFAQ